ncbi:hypothetical protein F511_24453 [Dorcoceras hygrometricum]|uniref:Uncharacterized protein n=1 Tax=Dorcoceras hygrometricum TaxID=472368 RepID=A0A2Z7CQX0_9LAMI|nr:hypothetical protein F511_24453 [Dorcoceras hygrometricum]
MAQYQILSRKPLGPDRPETNPRSQNSVATPPRVRRTTAHRRLHNVRHMAARCTPPCATGAHGGGHLRAQGAQFVASKRSGRYNLGITDSACKNQSVMVSVQYGPFNTYIPIRSTIIDSIGYPRTKASGESSTTKHRLLHASGPHPISIGHPRTKASGESSTTKHRLLHASGPHPIPPPNDPN